MEYEIIKAAGLDIMAKDIYRRKAGLPPHDLIMIKDELQRKHWPPRVQHRKHRLNQIMEIGIADGGSLPYLFDLCEAEFIVGIDILPEKPKIAEAYDRSDMKDQYALYFETDQTDRPKLKQIVQDNFPTGIDMIVDDASHLLGDTRATFEILFPHLRPGGIYVIEDYCWSQIEAFAYLAADRYRDQPTTTQMVFELTMLMCSRNDLISRVIADFNTITIVKGHGKVGEDFTIKNETVNWALLDIEALAAES